MPIARYREADWALCGPKSPFIQSLSRRPQPVMTISSCRRLFRGSEHESVALSGNCGYVPGTAPVVLQLRPQRANLAVDDVALGGIVTAPEVVQDLVARQDPPGVGGQQIEQAQLQRCQVHVMAVDPHPVVEDVDLQLTDANH